MASNRDQILRNSDGDSIAYALTLAMTLTLLVATTSGEVVMPFVPHRWMGVANLVTAVPVLALAAWRRWQLFEACLVFVRRVRGR
jgi:thiol:disulfide interchange protein